LNGRKQILIQDDIAGVPSGTNLQWRAHTNASVAVDGTTATLTFPDSQKTLQATILNSPSGVTFSTMAAEPMSQDPPIPTGEYAENPSNDGVTVLVIETTQGGDFTLQVLLNPQWSGMASSDFVTPPSVNVQDWSVTSHNGS
jgi:DNA replication initiation complex subunit (GINS family)